MPQFCSEQDHFFEIKILPDFEKVYMGYYKKFNNPLELTLEAIKKQLLNSDVKYGMNFSCEEYIYKPLIKDYPDVHDATRLLLDKLYFMESSNMGNIEFTPEGWEWMYNQDEPIDRVVEEKKKNDIRKFIIEKTEEMGMKNIKKENGKKVIEKSQVIKIGNISNSNFNVNSPNSQQSAKQNNLKFNFKFPRLIFLAILFIILVFLGYRLDLSKFNFGVIDLISPSRNTEQTIKTKPSLKFSDVKFLYYDSNERLMNGPNTNPVNFGDVTNPEVNLGEIKRIHMVAEIENDGNVDLLVFLKKVFIKTSSGEIVRDSPPNIPSESYPVPKGKKKYIGQIELPQVEILINSLKQDKRFFLQFKPEIEYFSEDKTSERILLNTIIRCGDEYGSSKLPYFRKSCVPEVVMN